jgi:PTS system nitrogen regulatory IIA component
MSDLRDILTPARTVCGAPGVSKKRLLQTIAEIISKDQPEMDYDTIFDQLIAREKLGSTGLGQGIAIPHCRASNCPQPLGMLITLADPVDFDSPDDVLVDLLFVLLVPEAAHQEHLDILANIARLLSQPEFCQRLRAADSDAGLFDAATGWDGQAP